MPKVVDHDERRRELVEAAAAVFSARGFHNISMRGLATELGVKRSTIYHYFPSKEALFAACSEHVLAAVRQDIERAGAKGPARGKALAGAARRLEEIFPAELRLMLDYLEGRAPQDVRDDPNMQLARDTFVGAIASACACDTKKALDVWCVLQGVLLQRYLDGGRTPMSSAARLIDGLFG